MLTNSDLPLDAQNILAQEHRFREPLCLNPTLSEELWLSLWSTCAKNLTSAQSLAGRSLTSAQRDAVLTKERRSRVLCAMMLHNELTTDEATRVLSLCSSDDVASALFAQDNLDAEFQALLGPKLPAADRLEWYANQDAASLSNTELTNALISLPEWWGTTRSLQKRSTSLKRIFARRPEVLTPVLTAISGDGTDSGIKTAAAGCVHISDQANQARVAGLDPDTLEPTAGFTADGMLYTHLALVNNPRATLAIIDAVGKHSTKSEVTTSITRRKKLNRPCVSVAFDQVSDDDTLDWLVRRASSYEGRGSSSPPRPYELAALASNPHLGDQRARRVADELSCWQCAEDLGISEVNRLLSVLKGNYAVLGDVTEYVETPEPVRYRAPDPEELDAEMLERVASRPASVVLSSTVHHYAAVRVLSIRLADHASAWALFASMFEANPNMELGVLADTCVSLSLAHQ